MLWHFISINESERLEVFFLQLVQVFSRVVVVSIDLRNDGVELRIIIRRRLLGLLRDYCQLARVKHWLLSLVLRVTP